MKSISSLLKVSLYGGFVLTLLVSFGSFVAALTCVKPPSDIIAWWPGDGNANDITIGAHHGELKNGATFDLMGKVGQAFRFDGLNDSVQVPDSNLWAFGTNAFTIEMWVNFESIEPSTIGHPQAVFIGNDEGSGIRNKWIFAFGGGFLYWHINSVTLGPTFLVLAPFSPVEQQWYHLAVTRSGNTYTIFVDGAAVVRKPTRPWSRMRMPL